MLSNPSTDVTFALLSLDMSSSVSILDFFVLYLMLSSLSVKELF